MSSAEPEDSLSILNDLLSRCGGSPHLALKTSPDKGRYVVATQDIPAGTQILETKAPITDAIMREYRKEVCAYCFHYDRGRNLPVRQVVIGKAFCSKQCQVLWREDSRCGLDPAVVHAAWAAVETFVQKSSKRPKAKDERMDDAQHAPLRPDADDVDVAFSAVRTRASAVRADREADVGRAPRVKARAKARREAESGREVEPDILTQLLPGVLLRADASRRQSWAAFRQLAHTAAPYASALTLSLHCDALLQLLAILPHQLLDSVTEGTLRDTVGYEAHNSFGIRSLDDAGDEFLGYGVWPEASLFNHSCAPTVDKARGKGIGPQRGRVWTYWTLRDVKAGDELSITYLGGEEKVLGLVERRRRLRSTWGFDCMCDKCKLEDGIEID